MYTKEQISAIAPADDKALIEFLLTTHEIRLRHVRESISADRKSLLGAFRLSLRANISNWIRSPPGSIDSSPCDRAITARALSASPAWTSAIAAIIPPR